MDKKEMLGLRVSGYSYAYIAEKAGLSRQRIQQVLSPPKEIRAYIITKYNSQCASCGIHCGNNAHIHHSNHDTEENYNDIDNLELLCPTCHSSKHRAENVIKVDSSLLKHGEIFYRGDKALLHKAKVKAFAEGKTLGQFVDEAIKERLNQTS